MKKSKISQRAKTIKLIALITLTLLFLGVSTYFFVSSNTVIRDDNSNQVLESDTKDVDEMMNKIAMDMARSEVDGLIGEPYECTQSEPTAGFSMDQCFYGDKNAPTQLNVTYMNGKVWGMSAVGDDTTE